MSRQGFEAELERPEGVGTWTYFTIPFSVERVFDSRSQVKVKGTVNGVPYRSTIMPRSDGTHYMVVNQSTRERAGVTSGSTVRVVMEIDTEARSVDIPEDFGKALEAASKAMSAFRKLSYSHQKEFVDWIARARKSETRTGGIVKAVAMILDAKRPRQRRGD